MSCFDTQPILNSGNKLSDKLSDNLCRKHYSIASINQRDQDAALRFRDYRLFTIGRILLFTGFQIRTIAVGWELYERTSSAMVLGGVGLVQVVPIIALTLITGHVADKYNRKHIMMLTVLLSALSSLGLAFLSYTQGSISLVYACLVFSSISRAFNKPASDSLLWQLIPTSAFTNAATWNSSSFHLAAVFGPALGGFAIASLGSASSVYLLAALATFMSFVCVVMIADRPTIRSTEPLSINSYLAPGNLNVNSLTKC